MNCNRCYICNSPIKKLSVKHFETDTCLKKLRQAKIDAQQYEGAWPVWEDAILYIVFFVNGYSQTERVCTKKYNAEYQCTMEYLDFLENYE
tara:strand:- start:351 stop:623 length:273 start_codon:yes stop_codon:yes gene_type:complete